MSDELFRRFVTKVLSSPDPVDIKQCLREAMEAQDAAVKQRAAQLSKIVADARKLFGLRLDYSQGEVTQRFVELVKAGHPDTGGAADIGRLTEAKRVLLANHANHLGDIPCPQCHGVGSIRGRQCGKCRGDGVV